MSIISSPLSYAVRLPVLGKYLGQLAFMLAMLTLVPLSAAIFFQDYRIAFRYLIVIGILLVSWSLSRSLTEPKRIQSNEALAIVALAFILSPLLMTIPIMGSGLSFSDALFEAISAVTTTGLSMVTDLENKTQTFLFARSWMQWYGGLGIVVLSVALLMGNQVSARSLAEPLGGETLATTTRTHARRMLLVYGIISIAGIIVVWIISGNGMLAVSHVLSAVSTGGFSMFDDSLAGIDSWTLRYSIISLCVCGAIPLPLYYIACSKNWRESTSDPELISLVVAVVFISLLLMLFLHLQSGFSMQDAFSHAFLLGMSSQTTAGFATLNLATLDDGSKFTMILSMLVGGSVGSTAGGIKLFRILILLRLIQVLLQRTTMPSQAVYEPKLSGKTLQEPEIQKVLILILLFVAVIVISWFAFIAYGYAPMNSLFEVVSATATVGLSTGITTTELPALLKTVLCLDMLLGRLEIIALLVVLYPPSWIGKRKESE